MTLTDKQRTARAVAAEEEARANARADRELDDPDGWAREVVEFNQRIDAMRADIERLPGGWDAEAQAAYEQARAEYAQERAA
jgi:hypothetical protein